MLLVVALAALFGLAELPFAAFMADDFIQLGVLEGTSPDTWTGPLDLYTISDGVPEHVAAMKRAGAFPWFFRSDFKMAFLRPASSALLALDHALFGLHPLGYRVHGVIWSLALAAGVGLLLRRALPGAVGTLAGLVFVLSGVHGILCWTAARHIVVAAACGVAALGCHLRWREDGWRPGKVLSLVGFALALSASEAALAVMAYLLAYEALGAAGSWRRRLAATTPALALASCYLVVWAALGRGVSAGSGYLSPLVEPLRFLLEVPGRLAFVLGSALAGGSADLWVLRPGQRPVLIAVACAVIGLVALLVRATWAPAPADQRRAVRWLAFGAVMSAVPFAASPIGARCLVVPLVGVAALVAFVLHRWWTALRRQPGWRLRLGGGIAVGLAVIHLLLAPLQRLAVPGLLRRMMSERLVTAMAEAELPPGGLGERRVVVLHAPDLVVGLHSSFYRRLYRLPMPASWHVLSWAQCDHELERTAPDTVELRLAGGALDAPTLRPGDDLDAGDMRATVLEVAPRGPTRVGFRFDRPLDDPSCVLLTWRDGRLRAVPPPPVGVKLRLP